MSTATAIATPRERPILFSSAMVRAILDGRKSQTRRIVKPQPPEDVAPIRVERFAPAAVHRGELVPGPEVFGAYDTSGEWGAMCPYGAPGDRLWVKETIRRGPTRECPRIEYRDTAEYAADGSPTALDTWPWRRNVLPSIHCPRGLSRLTLEITGVRVERVQDISEADAKAEGASPVVSGDTPFPRNYRHGFAALWDSINKARGFGVATNPWVWAVSFRVVRP